jgi:hypothetical protein
MSKQENRTLEERLTAWGRGEEGAFKEPKDPDDPTLASPRRPTTKPSTPRSSATPSTYAKQSD